MEQVSGVVDRIIYRADDSGYTVCVVKTGQKEVVLVGTCATIWAGENITAEGSWERHKQYGSQFSASRIQCVEPGTPAGIKKYLASGLIKGIGKVLAERLVKKFGVDALRIIEHESARLQSVEGIGKKRREQIKTAWNEHRNVREIMIFLHSHAVSTAQAMRIHKTYGDDAIALIKENPYRLASDIWGIGFKTADGTAMSIGISPHSQTRARAGLVYSLQTMADQGHCYCSREQLLEEAEKLLSIPRGILNAAVDAEISSGSLVQDQEKIYLVALYQAETGVAASLRRLQQVVSNFRPIDADKAIAWAAGRMNISFAPGQAQALKKALTGKITIITGGPGVGKTTIIRALVDVYSARKLKVCLAAPTGRAAKRMQEATRHRAMTLHRLLKFLPATGGFEHNSSNPIPGDVFIVDEVSMIDIVLMNIFLCAVPGAASLILVGDADQLPSVGPGNVLRDLIGSGAFSAVTLNKIFRQNERSWIVHNAHLVNTGRYLEFPADQEQADFYFVEENDPDKIVNLAVELITKRIPRKFGFNSKTEIQLLTPMRRFQLGLENMNAVLQAEINPRGASVDRFGSTFRVSDRVMQLRNNYDKDVFNGDVGFIREVDEVEQSLRVDFDGRLTTYDFSELDELGLAYACSIHKAQGSEYLAVVILMTTQHYKLLQRNLLYTAITRGRRLVCLLGSKQAIGIAIRNTSTIQRQTGLKERVTSLRT